MKTELQKQLFALQDPGYREFHARLIPGIPKEDIIGIRTPVLRKFAGKFARDHSQEAEAFLKELPHRYYEENNLHMLLVTKIEDYPECLRKVKEFLPYINNWATCDLPAPKCFEEYREEFPGCVVEPMGSVLDKAEQARRVFDALRAFDATGVTAIFAQCPGEGGLGLAVANRLKKAAGFQVVNLGEGES